MVLADIDGHRSRARSQDDEQASYAHKILKPEAQVDWRDSAVTLDRKVRAFNPFPVCFSVIQGQRVRIWQASEAPAQDRVEAPGTILRADDAGIVVRCGAGALTLEVLQLAGGKALSARQLLGAHQAVFAPGLHFDLPTASMPA